MIRKLFLAGGLNIANSLLSVIITIIIVQKVGVGIVGELYVLLATCSLILLSNILLPPSYSLVKIQNSQIFVRVLFTQYFYVQFIVFMLAFYFTFSKFGYLAIVVAFYCCFTSWLSFFDILLQSKGLIKDFYLCNFYGNTFKSISLFLFLPSDVNIIDLLVFLTLGQAFTLMFMVYINKTKGRKLVLKPKIRLAFTYYSLNFSKISGFYVTAIFKRLFDNLPALLFGGHVSSAIMGVFSIYQKSLVFGVSFIRILESALLHRGSNSILTKHFKFIIVVSSMILTFIASLGYTYATVGLVFSYSFYLSLLIIPIYITIEARTFFVKTLSMLHVNLAMFFSMLMMFLSFYFYGNNGLNSIFTSYSIMLATQAFWLGLNLLRNYND